MTRSAHAAEQQTAHPAAPVGAHCDEGPRLAPRRFAMVNDPPGMAEPVSARASAPRSPLTWRRPPHFSSSLLHPFARPDSITCHGRVYREGGPPRS